MIFANGLAGAADGTIVLCIGVTGLLVALLALFVGLKLTRSKRKLVNVIGVVLLLISFAFPFVVCSGFQNIPNRSELQKKIEKGMTKQEVIAVAGDPYPNSKRTDRWYYTTDFWGIAFFIVSFDKDDRVESVYTD